MKIVFFRLSTAVAQSNTRHCGVEARTQPATRMSLCTAVKFELKLEDKEQTMSNEAYRLKQKLMREKFFGKNYDKKIKCKKASKDMKLMRNKLRSAQ